MSETAYLIDGTAYIFRSYYSMRPIAAPDGTPINAVFGLGMTLQKLLNDHDPRYVAVAFDAGARTFRNDLYKEYKANRGEPPEDLIPQFDLCCSLTQAMGLATLRIPGFEADDILATLVRQMTAKKKDVVLVTGDKDMTQGLREGVSLYDLAKGVRLKHGDVPGRMGVRADQVVDLLALMGDSSDNIPGVKGIGAKGAVALLEAFGSLDAIYERLDEVEKLDVRGAKSLAAKLARDKEQAYLCQTLATVRTDVPMSIGLDELQYSGADNDTLDGFAEKWGLGRVAARVKRR